jgi:hypothetical protein
MLSMAHCIPDSARILPRFCAERERTATRTFLIQSAPALGAEYQGKTVDVPCRFPLWLESDQLNDISGVGGSFLLSVEFCRGSGGGYVLHRTDQGWYE